MALVALIDVRIHNNCFFSCLHCKKSYKILNEAVLERFLRTHDIIDVMFSGGEPFYDPTLLDNFIQVCLDNLVEKIYIRTTGVVKKDEKLMPLLDSLENVTLIYKLYGDKETHNRITCVDSFDLAVSSMKMYNLFEDVSIDLYVVNENCKDVIVDILESDIQAKFTLLPFIHDTNIRMSQKNQKKFAVKLSKSNSMISLSPLFNNSNVAKYVMLPNGKVIKNF